MNEITGLDDLEAQHAALEQQIDDERSRPLPDQTHLSELKRRKLRIKEEIAQLSK